MEDLKLEVLSDEERRLVEDTPETGFIEDFRAWAAMQTDAPEYTLKAAALQALSLAAGDTTVLTNYFSSQPTYLNLYTLIIGPSTVMRKSTVLGYIEDLLPKNQQTHDDYITWLSDVSIQAFYKAAAAAGKSMAPVMFTVDEVASLFSNIKSKSNHYLSGFDATLLQVYDHSPIRIQRVNGATEAEEGAFVNFIGVSTPEPVLEALDGRDMASGLLPRLIIFDARHAARGERLSLMERRERKGEAQKRAEALRAHLYEIARPRADGIPTGTNRHGDPIYPQRVIPQSPEATERLDAIDALFDSHAIYDSSAIGAIKGRAFLHIHKLAGLFALSRGGATATIELIDVLRAAALMEATASDLITMIDEVGSNATERMVASALAAMNKNRGKRAKQSAIARQLKLSLRESRELLGTLMVRGLVELEPDPSGGQDPYWKVKPE